MGRHFRNTITKGQVRVKQNNGVTYVYEREYKYDQDTKRNRCISNKLIGKILPGTEEIVATRPKKSRRQTGGQPANDSPVDAKRSSDILADILDWAGRESGIDADLRASMSEGDALKTMSIARFWTVTRNATIPDIETWQLTHPIPYTEGLSADVCYNLFESLGPDESVRQSLFAARAARLGDHPMIAYDSTTISTWSELLEEARYGFNKAGDGRKTVKYLMLYAVDIMQPIAFAKQGGNITDIEALSMALSQLIALGVKRPQLVTDCGYYSEAHLRELCYQHFDFICLAKKSAWITDCIEQVLPTISQPQHSDPESSAFVQTVRVTHEFTRQRKYASTSKDLKAGESEKFSRRLYIHVCYEPPRKIEEDAALIEQIREVKQLLEYGTLWSDLTPKARKTADRFLQWTGRLDRIKWDNTAYEEACRYHGIFVLVTSHEKEGLEALHRYRHREKIEEFFAREKEDVDGNTTRVWTRTRLMGRMIVQFAALCYDDFLRFRIKQVEIRLQRELEKTPQGMNKDQIELDKKLLSWLKKISFHNLLAWFGIYENETVSASIRTIRWNDVTTKRDQRFLELLMRDTD